jgi:hypothetical protein
MALQIDIQTGSELREILSKSILDGLVPPHRELVPDLAELYELELAFCESRLLDDEQLIRNGAYFARVGDTLTRHFLMCSGEPLRLPRHSSSRLRSFFSTNQFRTGYATHGLFPYRGKFHPQMIKGVMNAMGLKPGDTVLDPMMGSGTVLIEARLMGIHSKGVDMSPFCRFMSQTKLDALTVSLDPIRAALANPQPVFEYFTLAVGQTKAGSKARHMPVQPDFFTVKDAASHPRYGHTWPAYLPPGSERQDVQDFLLLAYLDSVGYSERSDRKSPFEQFRAILDRYLFVASKIQLVLEGIEHELGEAIAMEGDSRSLPFPDGSIDGVVFSPPYSFAIDYLENDSFHLRHMGVDIAELRQKMIGLRGDGLREKFNLYTSDMGATLAECARVLRPGKMCTIIVGTNNNQLSRILGVRPEEVRGIDEMLTDTASSLGLAPVRKLSRRIAGIANTMRTEYIVMLQKNNTSL